MKKETMLKKIAQKGYDVSYAANLKFATYDIVKKFPSLVSFVSIVVGILGLVLPSFQLKGVSICILILGILTLYTNEFAPHVDEYGKRGGDNTALLYRLKNIYYKVKDSVGEEGDYAEEEQEYEAIEKEFNSTASANQILFANWFAHYKLFVEKDYSWMDEQLHFGVWHDMIPGSAKAVMLIILVVAVGLIIANWCEVVAVASNWFICGK